MKKNNRRGAVVVEFALMLPLLFLFLFGCYEICRANIVMHTCESAAYEGARAGIVPGATPTKTNAAAQSVIETLGINAQITTVPDVIDNETEFVSVTIDVDFSENSVLIPKFIGANIRRTCTMNREEL